MLSFYLPGRGITFKDPDNVIITSEKLSLSRMTIYQLINPKRGVWTLTVSVNQYSWHEFLAKSSSDTNVDFEHYFLIPLLWRKRHAIEVPISSPVIGKSNQKSNKNRYRCKLIPSWAKTFRGKGGGGGGKGETSANGKRVTNETLK